MTEHDWAPICEEDPAIMCNVCFQCQCCETPTEECPGEWAEPLMITLIKEEQ